MYYVGFGRFRELKASGFKNWFADEKQDRTHFNKKALKMGFAEVASGPFVRSSYHAQELFQEVSRR